MEFSDIRLFHPNLIDKFPIDLGRFLLVSQQVKTHP